MDALFLKRLQESQKAYADSKAQAEQLFGGAKVPAGVYEATLTAATLGQSKKGKLQVKRSFVISTAGDYEGSGIVDYMQCETEYGYAFLRRFVELLTGEAAPLELKDYPDTLKALSESAPSLRIEVRHDGDFQNISVMEKIGEGEAPAEASAEETTPEAGTDEDAENLAALKAFASSQDITFEEEDTVETLKERISAFEYDSAKLIEEEIALLEKNELSSLIQKSAPAKPPVKVAKSALKPTPKPTPKPPLRKAPPARRK